MDPHTYNEQPTPEHPLKRERPDAVASLFVYEAETPDLNQICATRGPTEIIDVRAVLLIPAVRIEVVCADRSTAFALMQAWYDYAATSPHRPHTRQECEAWSRKWVDPEVADISPEWTF